MLAPRLMKAIALLTQLLLYSAVTVCMASSSSSTISTASTVFRDGSGSDNPIGGGDGDGNNGDGGQMPVEPSPEEPSHTPGSDIAGEQAMGWALFIISALLILSLLTSYILRRRKVTVIQEGFVSIAAGMLVGLALRLQPGTEVQNMMNFDADIFFNVLLPPIILSSGYQLHKADFFINLVPIAVFAFIGTFISAMVIGVLLYAFVITGVDSLPISLLDCFIVGSVLSATDPVTVLAVIKQMKVEPRLDAIVSGESLLNDAVAIVLFTTLRMFRGQDFQLAVVGSGVLIFLNVLFSSLAIGIGFALLSALLFKYTDMHLFPSIESCLVLIVAYSSYFFSNGLGKSGIVSLLFCGMTMRHYVTPSLSHHSKITINEVFEIMSRISENFIFVDLGLTLFTDSELIFRPIFIIIAAVIVVISRAAAIFPLSKLMNSIHRKSVEQQLRRARASSVLPLSTQSHDGEDTSDQQQYQHQQQQRSRSRSRSSSFAAVSSVASRPLSPMRGLSSDSIMSTASATSTLSSKKLVPMSYQMLLLWAGLRGAVAVALAAQAHHSPADGSKPDEKNPGPYIRAMVLGVVVITVVVFGGTTRWLINHAGIRTGENGGISSPSNGQLQQQQFIDDDGESDESYDGSDVDDVDDGEDDEDDGADDDMVEQRARLQEHWFTVLDTKYLRPWLTRPPSDRPHIPDVGEHSQQHSSAETSGASSHHQQQQQQQQQQAKKNRRSKRRRHSSTGRVNGDHAASLHVPVSRPLGWTNTTTAHNPWLSAPDSTTSLPVPRPQPQPAPRSEILVNITDDDDGNDQTPAEQQSQP